MSQADNRGMASNREGVAIWMSRKEWEALRLHAAQDGKTLNAYCEIVLRNHLKWREGGEKKSTHPQEGYLDTDAGFLREARPQKGLRFGAVVLPYVVAPATV